MRASHLASAVYFSLAFSLAQASPVPQASTMDADDAVAARRGVGGQQRSPFAVPTAAASLSDAPIFGLDVRQSQSFSSTTSDFVPNYAVLGPETRNVYGLDFNADATTLFGVDNTTLEVVEWDLLTGAATPTGVVVTGPGSASGLTASTDGSTWYLSEVDVFDSHLYVGDIATGVFNYVGTIAAGIIIDIAMDSEGGLYGLSVSDDSLYSIDPSTGAGTVVGTGIGLGANFAQGMDFDWSNDTLYATVYTGGGTGMFCSIDTTTGVANMLQDTSSSNAEMEMAVQVAAPTSGSPIYGLDFRGNQWFSSHTSSFVSSFTPLASDGRNLFGIDFNSDASVLYGIDDTTLEVCTVDLVTGLATPTGALLSGATSLTGLTASTDGRTWYLSDFDGTDSQLYVGDIESGQFSLIGDIVADEIIIDLSISSTGELYGLGIVQDSLYAIDTTTGVGTRLGAGIGPQASFAQGMDFDWSDDTLYATVYTGAGSGKFCSIDVVTGLATVLEDTLVLDAEMEMAVQSAAPLVGDTFCQAAVNSTGSTAQLCAVGTASLAINQLSLHSSRMPMNAFGIFIASQTQDFVPMAGGSMGNLCLGGVIGRGVSSTIYNSGGSGSFSAQADLTSLPSPMGPVAAMSGETWNFQAWFRDAVGGVSTSNYTNGVSVVIE